MDSVILNEKSSFDWEYIKTALLEGKSYQIDTHLGKNYISRMLQSKKIYNCNITRQYVGTGKNKRPCGWVLKLN